MPSITNDKEVKNKDRGKSKNLLPVLIIPGFMSSGMTVQKSSFGGSHIGERVWMNPLSLGFSAFYTGRALEKKKVLTKKNVFGEEDDENEDDDEFETPPGEMKSSQFEEEVVCKSKWLHHLTLSDDALSERKGNEVRPIPGLAGVDFLTDIATIKVGSSYVFGKVINMLLSQGYTAELNLDAASYDWRIPPSLSEERDKYFTITVHRIERMYEENDNTPVVLLCHSLGCKVGHYLLNFAKLHHGQEWLDKYVHTYMPVGGVHLGAPLTFGYVIAGIEMSPLVDPILSQEERLVFARSLGSGPWMIPRSLPSNVAAIPNVFVRQEGRLEVMIKVPIGNLNVLVETKRGTRTIDPLRLAVNYGNNKTVQSRFSEPQVAKEEDGDGLYVKFSEMFLFATPPTLKGTENEDEGGGLEDLQFFLKEQGSRGMWERQKNHPVLVAAKYLDKDYLIKKAIHETSKASHLSRLFASSCKHSVCAKTLSSNERHEMEFPITFYAQADTHMFSSMPKEDARNLKDKLLRKPKKAARSIEAIVQVRWLPPPPSPTSADNKQLPLCADLPETGAFSFAPDLPIESKTSILKYEPKCGQSVLQAEGLEDPVFKVTREKYDMDPLGPRALSAEDAPPVKRVYAIHGINVPTPVGYICCRPPTRVKKEGKVKPNFILDESAHIIPGKGTDPAVCSTYDVVGGVIQETSKTPQKDLISNKTIHCCGDGTVPYWSLQHPQNWQSEKCRVRMETIEGINHRDILGDKRFHKLLLDYVGGKERIEAYEAEAVKKLQNAVRQKIIRPRLVDTVAAAVEGNATSNEGQQIEH